MTSDFYRAFEDRHRGSREVIQSRQRVYLPFVRPLVQLDPTHSVVDLGCGRGEWLELLASEGITAFGIDQDDGMLQACRERGLNARQGDAIEFLKTLPDASQLAVTAFQVVEHLPFDALHTLAREALRVLRPGGLLILETPNPENLVVGSSAFYMDPTHQRPLPPQLLAFLPEYHGFGRVKVLRLQEGITLRPGTQVSLLNVLAGVSPDYAVIAQKEPTSGNESLDAAFARDYGVTLNELADRYESQWTSRFNESRIASERARGTAMAAQESNAQALARAAATERRLVDEVFKTQGQLHAMRNSTSWRLTAPVRWIGEQRLAWREQGTGERIKRLAFKAIRIPVRGVVVALDRNPRAHLFLSNVLRVTGLGGVARQLRARFGSARSPEKQERASMTPAAQRVYEKLQHAMAVNAGAADRKDS